MPGKKFSSPLSQRYVNLLVCQVKSGMMVMELAAKVGITPNQLSRVMYGHDLPAPELKKKLSELFDRSEGWLFRRDGHANSKRIGNPGEPEKVNESP